MEVWEDWKRRTIRRMEECVVETENVLEITTCVRGRSLKIRSRRVMGEQRVDLGLEYTAGEVMGVERASE